MSRRRIVQLALLATMALLAIVFASGGDCPNGKEPETDDSHDTVQPTKPEVVIVSENQWRTDWGSYHVAGEVKNNGTVSASVHSLDDFLRHSRECGWDLLGLHPTRHRGCWRDFFLRDYSDKRNAGGQDIKA
jgi:hypothetical protein